MKNSVEQAPLHEENFNEELSELRKEVANDDKRLDGDPKKRRRMMEESRRMILNEEVNRDKDLKNGIEKVYNGLLQPYIDTFLHYNKIDEGGRGVENVTRFFVQNHPDLAAFIAGELGLPAVVDVRRLNKMEKTKFSSLTMEQKFKFMCLAQVGQDYQFNGEKLQKASSDEILEKYQKWAKTYTESINDDLKTRAVQYAETNGRYISDRLSFFASSEGFLKSEFGLNSKEAKKVKNYLENLSKNYTEAGSPRGYVIVGILAFALGLTSYYIYDNMFSINPEVKIYGGQGEITNFKDVFQLITQTAEFRETGTMELRMCDINGDESFLLRLGKDIVNRFESKRIDMSINGELACIYNVEDAKCFADGENKTIKVKVHKPEIKIHSSHAHIDSAHREWVNLDEFDNAELDLEEQLKLKAIQEASQSAEFFRRAKESLRKNLLKMFNITGLCQDNVKIKAGEVKDVIVEYYED